MASRFYSLRSDRSGGFTLIELLIVVAIIAILAAIAVPNFLEAQTRSKISHVKSDLRTYATAMGAYNVDFNSFPIPYQQAFHAGNQLYPLTTPTAYITNSNLVDPFESMARGYGDAYKAPGLRDSYVWANYQKTEMAGRTPTAGARTFGDWFTVPAVSAASAFPEADACLVLSMGPSDFNTNAPRTLGWWMTNRQTMTFNSLYDPTNGTVSAGSIIRFIGETQGLPDQP